MGFKELFFEWQNLIFVLPFIGALFYLMLQAAGAFGGHDVGAADAGVDHDIDADHDLSIDHGVGGEQDVGDAGGDADHDVGEASSDAAHDAGVDGGHAEAAFSVLNLLGVGKVPLSIIVMTLFFIWGFTGWAGNLIFGKLLRFPIAYVWPSLALAAVCSVFLTRAIAGLISRVLPSTETYLTGPKDFIGKTCKSRYAIKEGSGACVLYDKYNQFQEIQCRVKSGAPEIPPDADAIIVGYRAAGKYYLVRPNPLTTPSRGE